MIDHQILSDDELYVLLKHQKVILAGNSHLKIYGQLSCRSGKRMQRKNRVFFQNEQDALDHGYRPCGHCMKRQYRIWKNGSI
ncbi:metal-binding protein [Acinetobacter sp. ANC 4558]|uniref:Ada metal-binding domain-containing protein n=1 Tax=Acinetobacter sp. ANC 4558 TaxID=1977876 RepID=UPI000A3317C7|nr:Ada metal-binding domain-containing protein [Acinetobacter sp. ANC 4558]OTG87449.1 metal-binding protein [Acinetobacter sp. ANC 4558]